MIVESWTFIWARAHGPGCVLNASGIRTLYGLKTTIRRCKGLRCLLSMKSHPQLLRGLQWPQWLLWPQWLRWLRCWVWRVYEITATEQHVDRACLGWVRSGILQKCRIRSGQYGVNSLRGGRINTLGGVRVNTSITRMISGQNRHHQDEFRSTSECVWCDFRTGHPVPKPSRSSYSMVWIIYEKWAGNEPQLLGRCGHIETPGERGSWYATVRWVYHLGNPRNRRWQLWPWIHTVCGLLHCENEKALLAVQCVPSP